MIRHWPALSSPLVIASSLLTALACSAGGAATSTTTHGGGSSQINPGGAGTGATLAIGGDTSTTGVDPTDTRKVPVRQKTCDAMGNNCTCLRLALLGTLTSAATDSDSTAFQTWLNGNSMGTAVLNTVPTQPTIDDAFLAKYDILLVANVNTWVLSAADKAAIQKWVTTTGGGIITLTGFASTPAERDASSQVISFSGVTYGTAADTSPPAAPASGQAWPVHYKGGTADLKNCLNWTGGGTTTHSSPLITTPIEFTPQTGSMEKLTASLDYVGAFIGWPVTAPAGATVVAKDPVTGGNMAVAYEYMGAGRIFAFGDEWVIFSNEWAPLGAPNTSQMDAYNPCWVPASGTAVGFFHSVETLYQTKQFWYDAINWVAPPNACNFVVIDKDVVVK